MVYTHIYIYTCYRVKTRQYGRSQKKKFAWANKDETIIIIIAVCVCVYNNNNNRRSRRRSRRIVSYRPSARPICTRTRCVFGRVGETSAVGGHKRVRVVCAVYAYLRVRPSETVRSRPVSRVYRPVRFSRGRAHSPPRTAAVCHSRPLPNSDDPARRRPQVSFPPIPNPRPFPAHTAGKQRSREIPSKIPLAGCVLVFRVCSPSLATIRISRHRRIYGRGADPISKGH